MHFILAVFFLLLSPNLVAATNRAYVGGSLGIQENNFVPGYGKGFFNQNVLSYEVFIGIKARDRFGYEFGISRAPDSSKDVTLNAGEKTPGSAATLGAGQWQLWRSEYSSKATYIGLNRLWSIPGQKKLMIYSYLGFAFVNLSGRADFVDDYLPGTPGPALIASMRQTFDINKLVPNIKLGLDYPVNSNFGCRLIYTWLNTARAQSYKVYGSSFQVKMHNSSAVHLGVYFMF